MPVNSISTDVTETELLHLEEQWGAHNYRPLDVVIERAAGVWVYDQSGRRYLDCLSAYSAVEPGALPSAHSGRRCVEQAQRVTLTSRAFRNDQLPRFAAELAELCGMEMVLPMNTGAEAVETAIKAVRRWGYARKGIPRGPGRDHRLREQFPRADHHHHRLLLRAALSRRLRPVHARLCDGAVRRRRGAGARHHAQHLRLPVRADPVRGGHPDSARRVPDAKCAEICRAHNVLLMVADEIQTGLGRTGRLLACQHEGVQPDVFILGKALSGGVYPVSAVVSSREILGVFRPGSHGSTYGGNPLACAVARAALRRDCGRNGWRSARRNWAPGCSTSCARSGTRTSRRSAAAAC